MRVRWLALSVAALAVMLMGCQPAGRTAGVGNPSGLQIAPAATQTPYPTYTPLSTYTPYPTLTAPASATPYPTYTAAPSQACATGEPTPTPPATATALPSPLPTKPNVHYLLPDLQVLRPETVFIQVNATTKHKEIRFDTTTINLGEGPLTLVGAPSEQGDATQVIQELLRDDGGTDQVEIGHFVLHPTHRHWHFEDFSEFQLYTLREDGTPNELVATTGKITSCVHDLWRLPAAPANSPTEGPYFRCGREMQGLSVGWADTYDATLPGQQLDIEGLPDGRYLMVLTVNRSQLIRETDLDNNSYRTEVEIKGFAITRQ